MKDGINSGNWFSSDAAQHLPSFSERNSSSIGDNLTVADSVYDRLKSGTMAVLRHARVYGGPRYFPERHSSLFAAAERWPSTRRRQRGRVGPPKVFICERTFLRV